MTTQRESPVVLLPQETTGDSRIAVHRQDGLAHLEICRPDRLNALSPDLARELLLSLNAAAEDPTIRAVLISGAGRAFCAGADLTVPSVTDADGVVDASHFLLEVFHPIVEAIREAPKPVVAAVQGACVGIGVAVALTCDLVVLAQSAYFQLPFVRIGLGLDGGASALLTERVGMARAAELALLGERLDAPRALEWGLVNRVVPDDELASSSIDLALQLAAGPTVALSSIKQALWTAALPDIRRQLELEATLQRSVGRSVDYAIGRAAFANKASPKFVGH